MRPSRAHKGSFASLPMVHHQSSIGATDQIRRIARFLSLEFYYATLAGQGKGNPGGLRVFRPFGPGFLRFEPPAWGRALHTYDSIQLGL